MGLFNNKNVPFWLENNLFFRKIFLLRKLYLSKTKFNHYSQFGEDISINKIFSKNTTGFFVDVGCFHPKKNNNTYQLYKKGWRGINIDIDSIKIEAFDMIRAKDTNISCAVSNTEGEVAYYSKGFYSLINSLEKSFTTNKQGYIKKTTIAKKLTNIINETKYKNKQIDFLSIDAEGHDLEVIKSLDFDQYNPKLIAIETYKPLLSEVIKTELYQFLIEKNYDLVAWCGLTLLMANKELQATLQISAAKL